MSVQKLVVQSSSIRDVFSQRGIKVLQRVGHLVHASFVHSLCESFIQDGNMCCEVIPELFEPFRVLVYGLRA